ETAQAQIHHIHDVPISAAAYFVDRFSQSEGIGASAKVITLEERAQGASSNIAPCRGDPRGRPYVIRTQRGQGSNLAQPRLAHPVDAMLAVLGLLVDEGTSQTPCWQGVWQGVFPGRASRLRPGAETGSAQGSARE